MSKERLFVEKRPQGDFAARRPNSERASAVLPTQAEAINRASLSYSPGRERGAPKAACVMSGMRVRSARSAVG